MTESVQPSGRLERYRNLYFRSSSTERLIRASQTIVAIGSNRQMAGWLRRRDEADPLHRA